MAPGRVPLSERLRRIEEEHTRPAPPDRTEPTRSPEPVEPVGNPLDVLREAFPDAEVTEYLHGPDGTYVDRATGQVYDALPGAESTRKPSGHVGLYHQQADGKPATTT